MKKQLKKFGKKTLSKKQGYNPEFLELWETASNYIGPDYSEYYTLVGYSRDSGPIDRSNFEAFRDLLSTKNGELRRGVEVMSFSHWGCGWFDLLMIHKNANPKLLKIADETKAALSDYPILDDSHYYETIQEEIEETHKNLGRYEYRQLAEFLEIELEQFESELEQFAYFMIEASEYYYGSNEIYLYIEKNMIEEATNIIGQNGLDWPSEEFQKIVYKKLEQLNKAS